MKDNKVLVVALAVLALMFVLAVPSLAQESEPETPGEVSANMGTGFTYQGYLTDGGEAAEGVYDFRFSLFSSATGGTALAVDTAGNRTVTAGLFTVVPDFGGDHLSGAARWLEIGVRAGDSTGAYTTLTPRQKLTPAPYALALPGLYTQQNSESPNLIGGYNWNLVTDGVIGAAISGGGAAGDSRHRVTDNYGVIAGGNKNQAGDGAGTLADANYASVGGGFGNLAGGKFSVVNGGLTNAALGNDSTVGGGHDNAANGDFSTISGGMRNNAKGYVSTIGGGKTNQADEEGAVVGGGQSNTARAYMSTVSGGLGNLASSNYSTVGGGLGNDAVENNSTISGGGYNVAAGYNATVGGGTKNEATASSSTVPGGNRAQASHHGELAYASGGFGGVVGTAQTSTYVLRNITTDAAPTELYLDGSGVRLTIEAGRTVVFEILIVANAENPATSALLSAGCYSYGLVENDGGTLTRYMMPTSNNCVGDLSTAGWSSQVLADSVNDALIIEVTGSAAYDIRWVAVVRTAEVQQ